MFVQVIAALLLFVGIGTLPPQSLGYLIYSGIEPTSSDFDIYIWDLDENTTLNLTDTQTINEVSPDWSREHNEITYVSLPNNAADGVYKIRRFRLGEPSPETLLETPHIVSVVRWSPDETKLLYGQRVDGFIRLFIYDRSTQSSQQVTTENHNHLRPIWAVDSGSIIYISQGLAAWDVRRLDLTTMQEQFISAGDESLLKGLPALSPDGSTLALYIQAFDWDDIEADTEFSELDFRIIVTPLSTDQTSLHTELEVKSIPSSIFWISPTVIGYVLSATPQTVNILDLNTGEATEVVGAIPLSGYSQWRPKSESIVFPEPTYALPQRDARDEPPPACVDFPVSRLGINMIAEVSRTRGAFTLPVFDTVDGQTTTLLNTGDQFRVIGQGVCGAEGVLWWPIFVLTEELHGFRGWVIEGADGDDYYVTPLSTD